MDYTTVVPIVLRWYNYTYFFLSESKGNHFFQVSRFSDHHQLFFHACYAVGLYDASSKEEAAKFVAQHIRTDFGTVLSPHSLRKYDKDKLAPHADFVIRKLQAMTKFLEDDFR